MQNFVSYQMDFIIIEQIRFKIIHLNEDQIRLADI
jgi:hypothetical protein